ncbi:MAG: glycosyltransferase [Bacteroidetes bacterium RIFOXYA12_FULL_35_11]|nr:MAG: glycosyltransferase [Bacteroidetes bacterium GWF2_35_48]OFY80190.1 MAG: glycosyltransferase [Bacteroidetes bacterium RIFOXYA12_FULL_35_11]OFY93512.1 MAG: glycosyltransferase [Bacteroidetes bacterium RIFOXYC12_FULL_35_7]OFY94576.1 MAG: glycosyltransferase [Bacteroidetes bacterium RIFOXYB2_FULL_35_7]HBX51730.1 glycosyltransferase family 1 protein [Bacteroidales bacterium]
MKIAVNTRLLLANKLEGIGWFTYEALKRITQRHSEHQFLFIFDRNYSDEFIFSNNIIPIVAGPQARHPFLYYWWFEKVIPEILKKHKADYFLSTDGFLSLSTDVPSIDVIHDINFLHYPKDLPFLTSKFYNKYFPKYAKKAKRIATVSEYSKVDIIENFHIAPEKIDVVYNGVNEIFKPLEDNEIFAVKEKYTQGKDYFYFVGALHPRKNICRMLQAFDEFKKSTGADKKMVIVGTSMFKTKPIDDTLKAMTHKEDVIFTGRLEPDELALVAGAAFALVFVPYFEGFGIPIVEAMKCDVPVITANVTSMPEVAGDSALLVDPFSVDSIKQAMSTLHKIPSFRNRMVSYGSLHREKFTWDTTANNLWDCMERAMGIYAV